MGRRVPRHTCVKGRPSPWLGRALWWALALALGLPAAWAYTQHGPLPLQSSPETWPALARQWVLQPDAGLAQPPHTWWTAAWLHASAQHLRHNLLALGLLSALAGLLDTPPRAAMAWLLA